MLKRMLLSFHSIAYILISAQLYIFSFVLKSLPCLLSITYLLLLAKMLFPCSMLSYVPSPSFSIACFVLFAQHYTSSIFFMLNCVCVLTKQHPPFSMLDGVPSPLCSIARFLLCAQLQILSMHLATHLHLCI